MNSARSSSHPRATDARVRGAVVRVSRDSFLPQPGSAPPGSLAEGQAAVVPEELLQTVLSALQLEGHETVLDVGATSAYQAALLSHLAGQVVSVVGTAERADERARGLAALGCRNVRIVTGSASQGFPPAAPYDAILVGAGATELPTALVDQLKLGGKLAIGLGDQAGQVMELLRKHTDGVDARALSPCHLSMLPGESGEHASFPWGR